MSQHSGAKGSMYRKVAKPQEPYKLYHFPHTLARFEKPTWLQRKAQKEGRE